MGFSMKMEIGDCDYSPLLGKILSSVCPQVRIKTNCATLIASLKIKKPDISDTAKDMEYLSQMSRKRRSYKFTTYDPRSFQSVPTDNILVLSILADPVQLNTLVAGMVEFLSKVSVATRKLGKGIRDRKRKMLKEDPTLYSLKGGGTVRVVFGIEPEKCDKLAKRIKFLTAEFLR